MGKREFDGILILRAALAIWLVAAPWLLPGSEWTHRLSGALTGVVIMIVAFGADRLPALRYLQAATALWVMFSAAVFEPGPIMISCMMTGLALIASSAVTRETFT